MKTQSDVTPRSTQHETPSIGTMKRFLELWSAGPALKKSIEDDPYAVVQQYHLELDPESVRPLWDRECALRYQQQNIPVSPAVQRYREFIRKKLQWRDTIREECAPAHPDFRTWRQRQIARTKIQIGVESDNQMVHAPVAFELAKGCSVGCWFCGFDALPLSSIFEYNQENAALWQDVLQTVKEIIGPATKWAACYYATEPLDNPGYEQFCLDLCRILGMFPQTTTALPLKDVKRTRALLELSKQQGSKTVNRFSVLSLKILEKLYQEFHPDELEDVELIIQAQESDSVKAVSGKFLKKTSKHTRLKTREYQKYVRQVQEKTETIGSSESEIIAAMPATISCISGFLINMVEKSVKLISPCKADERWPLGYIIYDEGRFTDAAHLHTLLETMIENNMSPSLNEEQRLQFMRGARYESLTEGFRIATAYSKMEIVHNTHGKYFKMLGDLLHQGDRTAGEIAMLCFYQHGIAEKNTLNTLDVFFKNGMLNEEPAGNQDENN